jgi:hypothetical protein
LHSNEAAAFNCRVVRDSLLRGHRVRSINLQFDYLSGCNRSKHSQLGSQTVKTFLNLSRLLPRIKRRRRAAGIWDFSRNSACRQIFFAAVVKMHVGEISKPIRTRLGFHIIQLADRKQARRMTFDEARGEIGLTLENEKR